MIKLDNDKAHNFNFSMRELKTALNTKKNSAPGTDAIHYEIIKQLPEKEKFTILQLMNKSCDEGKRPEQWKKATIIPLQKPNKDPNDPQSYRPISLTSAICKTMETMVNNKAKKILDNKLSDTQSGLRNNISTIDQLTRLESAIREGQLTNKKVIAVFLEQKLEDLKVLRRSPDLLNNVKIGQGQLQLLMEQILLLPYTFWSSDLNNLMNNPSNSPVISEKKMFR